MWTQQAYLKASNPEAGDLFGVAVAICGDLIVVGASGEDSAIPGDPNDNAATSAGAAYVYARNGGSWVQVAYLKASNPDPNDSFGREVAVSGDIVTVTAPAEDSDSTGVNGNQDNDPSTTNDTGAAYVFVRDGGAWSQQAYLKASNAGSLDDFGWSVAASGETVVVGAFKEDSGAAGVDGNQADNSAFNSGAAYVFVRNGSSWSQQAYLKASNPGLTDNFGTSVAASADTVLVGAPFERSSATGVDGDQSDDSLSSAGAVYVFVRAGNTWSQEAYLKASNTGSGDAFGQSVSASGNHAVIGAYWEDSATTGVDGNGADDTATDAGAAYVFHRLGAGWRQIAYLKASNTDPSDRFGQEVSISKDTVVVTAPYEDSDATSVDGVQGNAGSDVGAAYALRIGPQGKMRRVDEVHCNGSFVEPVRSGGTVTLQGLVAEEPELRLDLPPEDPASSRLRGPSGALGMVWLGTRVVAHGERSLVTDVVERRYVRLVERSGTAAIGTADFRIELPPESRARRFFVQTAVLGPGRVLSPVVQLPGSEEHGALGRLR